MPRTVKASRYDEGCAAAYTLGLIGDRWALLVVRELMLTPKRFTDIRAGLPGVTASVLASRLAELGAAGVLTHDPESGRYALTPDGLALRPVLHELGRWGAGRPGHDPTKFLSPTALMLSLPVMVNPQGPHPPGVAGFVLGHEEFCMQFVQGVPQPAAVEVAAGEVTFVGSPNAVGGALYGPAPVADLVAAGALQIQGTVAQAQRFADAFRTLG